MNLTRRQLLLGMSATLMMPKALLAQSEAGRPMDFARDTLAIHSQHGPHKLEVELAESLAQRARGLMDRDELASDAGMLFLYAEPQSSRSGFWMYRTRIPLDIAFIDEQGRIATIASMQPCTSSDPSECPVTRPGARYIAALEVNAGYFAEHGIEEGDCVAIPTAALQCMAELDEAV
ncbi:DUF192 domain-containing protein [Franzmannia qiaohouensis]|uniref:DUF192 domain-containing protein n=1 Tax=Franzmannia qiaohouensis TaxID=1329370 RepID=A0ABU1HI14_9GAMM|nr:DUF192 domain-containing protein [Halomonas qiaohouensis]MDR5906454.1 DUF192 domain-containing protein [Halomonas qiaohouensis]